MMKVSINTTYNLASKTEVLQFHLIQALQKQQFEIVSLNGKSEIALNQPENLIAAEIEAPIFSALSDLLSLDYQEITIASYDMCKGLEFNEELAKNFSETNDYEPKMYFDVIKHLESYHPLLADYKIADMLIRYNSIKRLEGAQAPAFSVFLMLQAYITAIISGNKILSKPEIYKSFIFSWDETAHSLKEPYIRPYGSEKVEFLNSPNESSISFDLNNNLENISGFLNGIGYDESIIKMNFDSAVSYVISSLLIMFSKNYSISKCNNCGKFFVPQKRSDELYCNRKSPQDTEKTCREYAKAKLWYDRMKASKVDNLYRNLYQVKVMRTKRNPSNIKYQNDLLLFKSDGKSWRKQIKVKQKTEEEFYNWLITGLEDQQSNKI